MSCSKCEREGAVNEDGHETREHRGTVLPYSSTQDAEQTLSNANRFDALLGLLERTAVESDGNGNPCTGRGLREAAEIIRILHCAVQSEDALQRRGAIAPGELGDDEPCRRCFVRRGEHDAVTSHDYEAMFLYTCEGCSPDVAWTSENLSEHPDYDHDFDWIPLDMDDRERPNRTGQANGLGDGTSFIASERKRQIEDEGWTARHDDDQVYESAGGVVRSALAEAAAVYAVTAYQGEKAVVGCQNPGWPWDLEWFKPASPIRMLAKAGALIAAEMDRRLRAGEKP